MKTIVTIAISLFVILATSAARRRRESTLGR